jgi:hypothetical protein
VKAKPDEMNALVLKPENKKHLHLLKALARELNIKGAEIADEALADALLVSRIGNAIDRRILNEEEQNAFLKELRNDAQ